MGNNGSEFGRQQPDGRFVDQRITHPVKVTSLGIAHPRFSKVGEPMADLTGSRIGSFMPVDMPSGQPWRAPLVPREASQEHRIGIIREILDHNVGIFQLTYRNNQDQALYMVQGSGFLLRKNGDYFIATAQHCINQNYTDYNLNIPPHLDISIEDMRLFFPNSEPITQASGKTAFHLGNYKTDVALIKVDNPDPAMLEGRGLDLITTDGPDVYSDDGILYQAGFPQASGGLLIREIHHEGVVEHGRRIGVDQAGMSGGPVFDVINGKVYVESLVSCEPSYWHASNPPISDFRNTVNILAAEF
jgi:hypothetical protein